jgi:hypothetical protein
VRRGGGGGGEWGVGGREGAGETPVLLGRTGGRGCGGRGGGWGSEGWLWHSFSKVLYIVSVSEWPLTFENLCLNSPLYCESFE